MAEDVEARLKEYLGRADIQSAWLQDLREFCSFPTVSAAGQSEPMEAAADWLIARMGRAGIEARCLKSDEGFPVVYGESRGSSDQTILCYNHYDVQPPEPLEEWMSDPFGPEIRGGVFYARGVSDNKGGLLSRIHAIEGWRAAVGDLPVTVKFLAEGEEESGSKHLGSVVAAHQDLLKANWCIWENARKDDHGRPTAQLGNKGSCKFELRVRVASKDSHSGFASLYPNALWRLSWALSTLKDADGRVNVPGFYDRVWPFTPEDAEVCRAIPPNIEEQKERMGLDQLLPGDDPLAVNRALYYEPTMNIQGISGGYTGPGGKTVNPSTALARLECRLVIDQDPHDIFERIKTYLADSGFDDIEAVYLGGSQPMRTPVDDPFVAAVARSCRRAYGQELVAWPTSPGSGPREVFAYMPAMPIVGLGVGHADDRRHAPNENIRVADYFQAAAHITLLFDELDRESAGSK